MNKIPASPLRLIHTLTLAGVCSAALVLGACRDNARHEASGTPATNPGPTPAEAWSQAKSYTFEQRDSFTRDLQARQAQVESGLSQLRADYSEARATESRRAAMENLRRAEVNFKEKLASVGTATADTWASTRDGVAAAWDDLQAAYAKARAD